MSKASDYEKPSILTRFRKGQSGNPKGRPRGRPKKNPDPVSSAFDIVIDRPLTIVQDGIPREVTVEEALQQKTYQDAVAGNRAAQREILKMIAKREKAITKKGRPKNAIERRIEGEDPTNADEALQILGIASHDPRWTDTPPGDRERLLLEPWAVQAAMSRRAGSRMTGRGLSEAQRCTLDADTIRWPEAAEL